MPRFGMAGSGVPLLPAPQRREIRRETLAAFRRYAEMVFYLRPKLRSIAFCLRDGYPGIEHDFRYSCDETPLMQHSCGEGASWCSRCEGWDNFLPWSAWLEDWNERYGNAEAFLAYCAGVHLTPYAVARRGPQVGLARLLSRWGAPWGLTKHFRGSAPDLEIVATPLRPWFEPDEVIALATTPSEAASPLFDAVYAAPLADAPRLTLALQLTAEADPRGAYITEAVAAKKLDHGSELLVAHRADWLGPLRLVAQVDRAAFYGGFPEALAVYFANHDAVAASANHRAWATVTQLEFLDPRDFPLRRGSFIEDIQPITPAMKSLQMLSGVRSRGISSLEDLTMQLGVWFLEVTCESVDELERLLRVRCLVELDSLVLGLRFPLRPEADIWDRLWTRAPWSTTLHRLTVRIDSHLALWSRTRAQPGAELYYYDSVGSFSFRASEAGTFSSARCYERSRSVDRTIELLAQLPSLDSFELEHAPRCPLSNQERCVLARELARVHPQARLQITARAK